MTEPGQGQPLPLDVVAFEREWLGREQHDGRKAAAIMGRFGLSVTRYYQELLHAVTDPVVMAVDPVTCRVVRERVERHRRSSSGAAGLVAHGPAVG